MNEPIEWEYEDEPDAGAPLIESIGCAVWAGLALLVGFFVALAIVWSLWQDRPETIHLPGGVKISTGKE
jgi:hypothetical protein